MTDYIDDLEEARAAARQAAEAAQYAALVAAELAAEVARVELHADTVAVQTIMLVNMPSRRRLSDRASPRASGRRAEGGGEETGGAFSLDAAGCQVLTEQVVARMGDSVDAGQAIGSCDSGSDGMVTVTVTFFVAEEAAATVEQRATDLEAPAERAALLEDLRTAVVDTPHAANFEALSQALQGASLQLSVEEPQEAALTLRQLRNVTSAVVAEAQSEAAAAEADVAAISSSIEEAQHEVLAEAQAAARNDSGDSGSSFTCGNAGDNDGPYTCEGSGHEFDWTAVSVDCPAQGCTEELCCEALTCATSGNNRGPHVCEDEELVYDKEQDDVKCPTSGCTDSSCCLDEIFIREIHSASAAAPTSGVLPGALAFAFGPLAAALSMMQRFQ